MPLTQNGPTINQVGSGVGQTISGTTNSVGTWTVWNCTYDTSTTSSATVGYTQILVQNWGAWNQTYSLTATTTNIATGTVGNIICHSWGSWNDRYQVKKDATEADIKAMAERRKADEARYAEQQRVYQEQAAARAVQAAMARKRADSLLRRCLTPQQREDLEKKDCFYLESVASNGERRRYRIDRGTHGNVKLLDKEGRIIGQYCVQPSGVPTEDAMLAQKLWIEADEKEFVRKANFTPRRAA